MTITGAAIGFVAILNIHILNSFLPERWSGVPELKSKKSFLGERVDEKAEDDHHAEAETLINIVENAAPKSADSRIVKNTRHSVVWDDKAVHMEFEKALKKIMNAEIIKEPFDHISVPNLFSDEFYQDLIGELPHYTSYTEQGYAGTSPTYDALHLAEDLGHSGSLEKIIVPDHCKGHRGCWKKSVKLHESSARKGRVLTVDNDLSPYPLWNKAIRLVHSKNFTGLLYNKFATATGISEYKRKEIEKEANGTDVATVLRNSAALRIEPTSYHLQPHVDMFQKIVTWQYFHPENFELENRTVGTRFYNLKPPLRNMVEINDRSNPAWFDYSHFDMVKEHPVIPNYFFAFAPNNHSWHGASIDPHQMTGVNQFSRRTFLGFITTKFWGFHHFHRNDWAKTDYFFNDA